jgi:UDP-GlcNAc:undecaprenyl-phosphate GlcNAc-1-phosphate transferase
LVSAVAATGLATAICANSGRVGTQLGVLDLPDSQRKYHRKPVPLVGGIAILIAAGLWFAVMLLVDGVTTHQLRLAMILCGGGAGLIGFVDDRQGIAPARRMALLFVIAFAALAIDPGLIATTARWIPSKGYPISPLVFCTLFSISAAGVVNAVNMADGQNGLAGGMYLIWIGCLLIVGGSSVSAAALMLLPLTLVFLAYNLRDKLFLGDCGSYGVTFVLGLLVAADYASGQITLATIIAWFFVPVIDCLRLMAVRASNGRSPFSADRDHLHHRLADLVGQRATLAIYLAVVASGSVVCAIRPALAVACIAVQAFLYAAALVASSSRVAALRAGTPAKL